MGARGQMSLPTPPQTMNKTLILAAAALTANGFALPLITQQPAPVTNSVSFGAALTNKIIATSTNPPLAYQWRLNGVDIPGAISNVFAITNIGAAQAGLYTAVVSDASGNVESKT